MVLERFLNIDHFAWTWACLRNLIEEEAEIGLVCRLILEEVFDWFWIDFEVDLGSEIGPKWGRKSSWKGDRKKKGKRWAYRSQLGVQDGVMLGWKSKNIEGKKKVWEREVKQRGWCTLVLESLGGRGPAVSLWLKPKAAPKNGGTEDWRIKGWDAYSLTRHWPKAWRITSWSQLVPSW